ncbi:MAG TPA: adenylate/guanylate cyclase domain-containing protein [Marinagarivorans sp.]
MMYLATNRSKLIPASATRYAPLWLSIAFFGLLSVSSLTNTLERHTSLAALFLTRGPVPPPEDVVIIALNTQAAQRLALSRHSHTWPRTVYATLLNKLSDAGAQLVVFDIAFKAARTHAEDQALAHAIGENGNTILYTYLQRHQISMDRGSVDVEQPIPPITPFKSAALASGHFTLPKNAPTVTHTTLFAQIAGEPSASQPLLAFLATVPLAQQQAFWRQHSDRAFPHSLPLEARAKAFFDAATQSQRVLSDKQAGTTKTPDKAAVKLLHTIFSQREPLLINFFGGPQTLTTLDIATAFDLSTPALKNQVGGKVVYIGYLETRQTEQQDAYATVYTSNSGIDISGVEISATVFANLKHNRFIRTLPKALTLLIVLSFLGLGFWAARLTPGKSLGLQLGIALAYSGFSYYLFLTHHTSLPITLPLLAAIAGNLLQLHNAHRVNRQRLAHISYALSQYLPNSAADALSRSINNLEQQHHLVHGVVLMTDIKGYTALSEALPAQTLHPLMNRYYEQLVSAVNKNGGTVANIVGDSLTAIWTGPHIDSDMCERALRTVLDMQSAIDTHPQLTQHLPTCYALHGGQFSLGNLGAAGHFEYSPVGDIINTTSRIEHFNRELDTCLLLSQAIAAHLAPAPLNHHIVGLGNFALRNKKQRTALFTLLNKDPQAAKTHHDDIQRLTRALQQLEQKKITTALTLLREIKLPALQGTVRFHLSQYTKP